MHGHNPAKCVWNIKELRSHLINAFKKKIFENFPVLRERSVPFGGAIIHSEVEDIFCDCCMPYDGSSSGDMIQCSTCKGWYHSTCINISCVSEYRNKKWFCVKCDGLIS